MDIYLTLYFIDSLKPTQSKDKEDKRVWGTPLVYSGGEKNRHQAFLKTYLTILYVVPSKVAISPVHLKKIMEIRAIGQPELSEQLSHLEGLGFIYKDSKGGLICKRYYDSGVYLQWIHI